MELPGLSSSQLCMRQQHVLDTSALCRAVLQQIISHIRYRITCGRPLRSHKKTGTARLARTTTCMHTPTVIESFKTTETQHRRQCHTLPMPNLPLYNLLQLARARLAHKNFTVAHSRSCMKYSMNLTVNSSAPSFKASSTYTTAAACKAISAQRVRHICRHM